VKVVVAVGVAVTLCCCTAPPNDPENSLDRIVGGTLRVGVTESDPWTKLAAGEPAGIEPELVKRLASELDADIEWFEGSEHELVSALELGQLDLVIGGFTAESPWSKFAALTHPYITTQVVVAVPQGEEVPEDITGLNVAVEEGTEAAGVLENEDVSVRKVGDLAGIDGPVAVDDWLLDDLNVVDTGNTLIESDHVMLVRLGENGWMVRLEEFLLENAGVTSRLLDEEGRP
jgi:polar amino acid transport system substrate-binding protein